EVRFEKSACFYGYSVSARKKVGAVGRKRLPLAFFPLTSRSCGRRGWLEPPVVTVIGRGNWGCGRLRRGVFSPGRKAGTRFGQNQEACAPLGAAKYEDNNEYLDVGGEQRARKG